jgi:hypothetical protein
MRLFNATQILVVFLNRPLAELALSSDQFAKALTQDFQALSSDPGEADELFSSLGLPSLFGHSLERQIFAWERVLSILRAADEGRYESIHKGTPFYFLGVAAYIVHDFERALFYMDCALAEDHRLHGGHWHRLPSGMFVRLDDVPEAQFGRPLVTISRRLFEEWRSLVATAGGTDLSLDAYRARLVSHAMDDVPALRTAVTAFLSFLLEVEERRKQLSLAPLASGSGEPFFLHLFKGGLLFETLLKLSPPGKVVIAAKPKATLNDLLTDPCIITALGFTSALSGLGAQTFDDLIMRVGNDSTSGRSFAERAVRATWGLRNATGHNLAWPRRPSSDEYEQLFLLAFGALSLVVSRLYSECPLRE